MNKQLIQNILNAVDSDDVLSVANYVDAHLNRQEKGQLCSSLKEIAEQKQVDPDQHQAIRQFFYFLS